ERWNVARGFFIGAASFKQNLAMGFLIPAVLLGGRSDTVAAEFLRVKLAIEDAPLFAVFQNFLFHGANFFARFGVPLFLFAQLVRQDGNDALSNRVAVLDKLNFIAGDKDVHHFVGQPDNFLTRESHLPFFQSLAQDQF